MTRRLGALLAGGRARRFGSDKALARLEDRPLLDWARDTLAPWTEAIVLCGRDGGLPDRPTADLGPLGGLAAALHHGAAQGFEVVLSLPCDIPVLPDDAIPRLIAAGGPAYLETCPVVGCWPCALAETLEAHLERPDRSMRGWAARIGAVAVRIEGSIANINTPDDLRRLAASRAGGPDQAAHRPLAR